MSGLLKQPGYRLYAPDSPEAGALLAEQGLSRSRSRPRPRRAGADRRHRSPHHRRDQRGRRVRLESEGWRPDLPDACKEPFVPLLWFKVHELLGRVPQGSTARFLQDGTLPD